MYKRVYILLILTFFCVVASMAARKFTLVIDAGHGGHDAGAVGSFSKEKNINLSTALAFGKYVERNCPDVNVLYTRKTDVFVTLHGRAELANKAKADLFISIHTNSLPQGRIARGLETYTLGMKRAADNLDVAKRENSVILIEKDYKQHYEGFDPNSAESYIMFEFMQDHNMARSVELAKLVQSNVCAVTDRQNKGVKQDGFLVLRETSMPSCLIELGYISTKDEEQWLNNDANIDKVARGIYRAFLAYRNKYDNNLSVPYRIPDEGDSEKNSVNDSVSKVKTETATPKAEKTTKQKQSAKTDKAEQKQPANTDKSDKTEQKKTSQNDKDAPVFKIQILVADRVLAANDSRLKGEKADYYKEGKMLKYTVGSSTNYNEIYKLRKSLLEKFPDSFIIAFKNGEKMNVSEAIKEYKNRKN